MSSRFTSVLPYILIGTIFRNVYNMCHRGPFCGRFWALKGVKILVFGHFLKKFSLVSNQYCFTWSLQVLWEVCGMWASEAQIFWAILGLEMNQNLGLLFCYFFSLWLSLMFSKVSSGFTSILLYMSIRTTFRDVYNMGFKGTVFVAILDPKVSKNAGLWSLSQKVFTGFTSALLHVLIASTFRRVENIGPGGPVLGPLRAQK